MIKQSNKFLIIISLLLYFGCGKKTAEEPEPSSGTLEDNIGINNIYSDSLNTSKNNNFFELEQSMEDIQKEIQILKNKVMNYEYNEYSPSDGDNYTEKLKSLINSPPPSHRISLKNGSVIEGTIEEDNLDFILVDTEVGKLTLKKSDILGIEDIILPLPKLVFIGHGKEEVLESHTEFSGKVMNQGNRRADFVRIIYNLWTEKTQLAVTDSTFLDGSQYVYRSGIITDTVLEPNESARFSLKISVPDSISVSYITRDIRWEMFD